jgi:hypothetical protein
MGHKMKPNSAKVIENSIFWQQHVYHNSKDPAQKARCLDAIERLLHELMEVKREAKEADLDRGSIEHKAWYDTTVEVF